MKSFDRSSGVLLALLGLCSGAQAASAQTKPPLHPRPPLEYKITDVVLTVSSHSPIQRKGSTTVHLQAGMSWFEDQSRARKPFAFSNAQMLEALQSLYTLRFFDLPSDLHTRRSVKMADDGTVRTSVTRLMDTGGSRVCFRTGEYEKCVAYGLDAPAPLTQWVEEIRATATQASSAQ